MSITRASAGRTSQSPVAAEPAHAGEACAPLRRDLDALSQPSREAASSRAVAAGDGAGGAERGEHNGLRDYLEEIRKILVPLFQR